MTDVREEVAKLWLAKKAAEKAYEDHPEGIRLIWNDNETEQIVARCEKSGKVILQSDDVLECAATGRLCLRDELGLPSLPPDEEDKEEQEAA